MALASASGFARALEIAVVSSQRGGPDKLFADALLAANTGSRHRFVLAGNLDDGVDPQTIERADLIVAVGARAAEVLIADVGRPIIATLIGRAQFARVSAGSDPDTVSAIVLDHPVSRHLQLVRAVNPGVDRVSLLFGPETLGLEKEVLSAAALAGLEIESRQVSTANELLPALERVLEGSDALLTLPDPIASGATTARAILLTSYRLRRPVFAFSRAYVEAGALAAVFSSPEDVARDLCDWLDSLDAIPASLPPPRAPARFGVAINRQVARALGLDVPSDSTILSWMMREALQ